MFSKYQFIKRLAAFMTTTALVYQPYSRFSRFIKPNKLSQTLKIFNLSKSNFSSIPNQNRYQEDFYLLTDLSREELAHAQELMNMYAACKDVRLLDPNDVEWIQSILTCFIMAHRRERNYEKAFDYMKELEDLQHKRGIKDTISVAQCHHSLACEYLDRQDFSKAKEYLEDVLRICKGLEDNQETRNVLIQGLNQLGFIYLKENQEEKALEALNAVVEKAGDEEIFEDLLIGAYENMQEIYVKRNEPEKYTEYIRRYLDLSVKYHGANSQRIYVTYYNLAHLFSSQNKFSEALVHAQKALQVAVQISSQKSQQAANCYSLLGDIYTGMNDFTKALENYERAIKISEKLPQDSLDFQSKVYFYTGTVYQSLGKNQEAKGCFNKSQELHAKANQGTDVGLAETLIQQAVELRGQKKFKESQASLRKALDIYENREPLDYAKIADLQGLMGQILFKQREWSKALEFLKEREKILEKFDAEPSEVQITYRYISASCQGLQNYDESLEYCQKILQSAQATRETRYVGSAYAEIGRAYEGKGMLKIALEAYEESEKFGDKEDPTGQASAKKILEIKKKISES